MAPQSSPECTMYQAFFYLVYSESLVHRLTNVLLLSLTDCAQYCVCWVVICRDEILWHISQTGKGCTA